MANLEEMIDDVGMRIFEIHSMNKCMRDMLECYIAGNEDYSHLLPVAKIICKRLEKLTCEYSELESEVYKKCFL